MSWRATTSAVRRGSAGLRPTAPPCSNPSARRHRRQCVTRKIASRREATPGGRWRRLSVMGVCPPAWGSAHLVRSWRAPPPPGDPEGVRLIGAGVERGFREGRVGLAGEVPDAVRLLRRHLGGKVGHRHESRHPWRTRGCRHRVPQPPQSLCAPGLRAGTPPGTRRARRAARLPTPGKAGLRLGYRG